MSIALYRRYRPESFQEVIGQDHVTKPLMAALEAGRTTHAYLFSGPRGCGKTTSARILARCLNCVEYPTAKPCGVCDSCKELARDGSGSLDVVELDAASHGGVDDARDLREQAGFAPVRDRFKIFIIDEAHMVTNQGFNALLKLVEEPPEHVKFIFATTEPEKVIGTIRSRTHHYPFRLVPPQDLEKYLALVCAREGVSAGKDLLSLVVRAGTGSVRDTLSVLDQIIGGSEGTRLDYDRAVALLGYTSAALLDEAVDAISARDGAALFGVVEKVVKSGHDPRRFVEDLLQRLRDLVIIALAGDEAKDVFVSVPEDQYERMTAQAAELGAERASQCADLTNEALTEMAGATAPRLQLELLCARLLIGRVSVPGGQSVRSGPEAPTPEVASNLAKFRKTTPAAQQPRQADVPQQAGQAGGSQPTGAPGQQGVPQQGAQKPSVEQTKRLDHMDPRRRPMPSMPAVGDQGVGRSDAAGAPGPEGAAPDQPEAQSQPVAPEPPASPVANSPEISVSDGPTSQSGSEAPQATVRPEPGSGQPGEDPLAQVAAQWGALVSYEGMSRVAQFQLAAARGPVKVEDGVLYVGFDQPGLADNFSARGAREVERIIAAQLGLNLRVAGIAGGESPAPKADAAQGAAPVVPAHAPATTQPAPTETSAQPGGAEQAPAPTQPASAQPEPGPSPAFAPSSAAEEDSSEDPFDFEEPVDFEDPVIWDEPSDAPEDVAPWPNPPVDSLLGSAAESFPMPPPTELPADYQTTGRDTGSVLKVPPVEDPFTHTTVGKWGSSATTPHGVVDDPDDMPDAPEAVPDAPEPEVDPEWEGAEADDPDISQSTKVGLQVVLERFDARVIEEIKES